jgi:hypothetical protein
MNTDIQATLKSLKSQNLLPSVKENYAPTAIIFGFDKSAKYGLRKPAAGLT